MFVCSNQDGTLGASKLRTLPARIVVTLLLCLCAFCTCSGCKNDSQSKIKGDSGTSDSNVVTVSDPVLCSVLESLLDDSNIQFLCPQLKEGTGLSRQQAMEIQNSRLIVLDTTHGGSKWSQQISLPRNKVIYSTFEVLERLIPVTNLATHSHGPGQPHSHAGIVSETWLDPELFSEMIQYVLTSMQEVQLIDLEQVETAIKRWDDLTAEINKDIDSLAAAVGKREMLVDQAGLEYLAKRLDWQIQIVPFSQKLSDSSLLKSELNDWINANPGGLIVMLNEPTPPLEDLFNDLKVSYLQLDISTDKFAFDHYQTSFDKTLETLKPVAR